MKKLNGVIIDGKFYEVVDKDFESKAAAARFLGGKKHHITNLGKVLSPCYPHYITIYEYYAEYIQ